MTWQVISNRVTMAFVKLPRTMENNEKMREKQVA